MSHSGFCPDHAICMDWIERRVVELIENFQAADTVYMSLDVYAQFVKTMSGNLRGHPPFASNGFKVVQIVTSVGTLMVKPIPHFSNFCYVGSSVDYQQLEQKRIDQEFEEIVLKDCERDG